MLRIRNAGRCRAGLDCDVTPACAAVVAALLTMARRIIRRATALMPTGVAMKRVWFALIVAGWLLAQGGIAQSGLRPVVQGSTTYISGGVGEDEMAALRALQEEY